jgi:long-chain acyl-CoA synthetase
MEPWIKQYDADVRPSLGPYPDKTLLDYLRALAAEHGNKPALLFKGATVSYARLEAESDAFGAALVAMGVRKGDRVALLLPNCPQFLVAEFGIWKAGGIVVALNPTYSERELEQALDTRAPRWRGADARSTTAQAACKGAPRYGRVIPTSIKDYLRRRSAAVHAAEGEEGRAPTSAAGRTTRGCGQCCARIAGGAGRRWRLDPDDRAVILSSGGTTGTPKGWSACIATTSPRGCSSTSGPSPPKQAVGRQASCCRCRSSTSTANVGRQPMAFVGPIPVSLVPESHETSRPAGHHQAR